MRCCRLSNCSGSSATSGLSGSDRKGRGGIMDPGIPRRRQVVRLSSARAADPAFHGGMGEKRGRQEGHVLGGKPSVAAARQPTKLLNSAVNVQLGITSSTNKPGRHVLVRGAHTARVLPRCSGKGHDVAATEGGRLRKKKKDK